MENHDTIYEQFRNAAEKSEAKDFPAIEKVWSRVEEKLENKVLHKKKQLWKKIAIAASLLLLFTIGFQFFKPQTEIVEQNNPIVNEETTIPETLPEQKSSEAVVVETSTAIKKEAYNIVEKQIKNASKIVSSESSASIIQENTTTISSEKTKDKNDIQDERNPGRWFGAPKFEAKAVKRNAVEDEITFESDLKKSETKVAQKEKNPPLLIIDGKAVTATDKKYAEGMASFVNSDDLEDVQVYNNPLYIINGVEYSEESLFGKNPTSPYAPLSAQEIESTTVIKASKAVLIYGEKGKNGVVIITTENKKPLAKKGK